VHVSSRAVSGAGKMNFPALLMGTVSRRHDLCNESILLIFYSMICEVIHNQCVAILKMIE
jgi:hypothetical protein